jgi:deazaflavin-dependent oxidoreductase (nitroreductase family)
MSAQPAPQPTSGHRTSTRPRRFAPHMARFNRAVTNKVSIHVAGVLPDFGIVIHKGRHSGTVYRTPVNVFRTKDGFRIALPYGPDADWVRNAVSFGAVRLMTRSKEYELTNPQFVTDGYRQHVPFLLRGMLRVLRVSDFLDFRSAT